MKIIFNKEIDDLKSPFADLINNNNFLNTNYNQKHENNYFSFNIIFRLIKYQNKI